MKKTFTKILSVVLCAVMVLGVAPLGGLVGLELPGLFDFKAEAVTYSGTCGDDLTWSLDTSTGVLNITGTGAMSNYTHSSNAPWDSYESYIKTVNIANSVTTIGNYAFYWCGSLSSVTIPDSVTTIGDDAFFYCTSLTSVTIPDSVTTIGNSAFYNCTSLTSITVDVNNKNYSNDNYGVLFNKDKTTLIQYPIGNTRTSYIIPDSVTTIGSAAFYHGYNLTNVTIGNSVKIIVDLAFFWCNNLTSFTVDKNNKYYLSDSYGVLFNKSKTTLIQYPIGNTRTSYTIPDSVTTLGYGAFAVCSNLTSVTIPNSVKSIGILAFDSCYNIIDVYYTGTDEQWDKISIGSYNEDLTSGVIYYLNKLKIKAPYTTSINYGETLVLQLEDVELPEGLKVEWSIIGNAVTMSASDDGKECRITSTTSGNVSVTATVVDENGEPVLNTNINIKSNANFWQKIVSFFKNLFGINRIIY